MKALFILFCSALLTLSCSDEKAAMLDTYDTIFEAYCSGNFESVYESLDQPSKKLINRLISNETPDSLIQIGSDYDLPYLSVVKYAYFDTNNDSPMLAYHFIPFMGYLGVSFLNTVETYNKVPDKSKVGPENFLAIGKMIDDTHRQLDWVKFTKEGDEYKLNLVYTLSINEPLMKDIAYNSINSLEVDKNFKHEDLYQNYPNYRDTNFALRLVMKNCKNYDSSTQ
jgi:hypothetical protein